MMSPDVKKRLLKVGAELRRQQIRSRSTAIGVGLLRQTVERSCGAHSQNGHQLQILYGSALPAPCLPPCLDVHAYRAGRPNSLRASSWAAALYRVLQHISIPVGAAAESLGSLARASYLRFQIAACCVRTAAWKVGTASQSPYQPSPATSLAVFGPKRQPACRGLHSSPLTNICCFGGACSPRKGVIPVLTSQHGAVRPWAHAPAAAAVPQQTQAPDSAKS